FNMSFHEIPDDIDDSEVDMDESGRPCFSSIAKGSGFLDKDLAASGFTRKDQEDIEKFVEGGIEKDADSGDEENEDGGLASELNESDISGIDSLHLVEQPTLNCDVDGRGEENEQKTEAGQTNGPETQDASDEEEDNETMISKDAELTKRLRNQNRRVIASVRGGRKNLASRNTYKDKGDSEIFGFSGKQRLLVIFSFHFTGSKIWQ
ncbi:hypothetical protein CMV_022716, partial [Castanea mollissima]